MKLKLTFLAGAAVGYVLGARAGRDRYDEMKQQADALWHDPRVQEKVAAATDTVKEKAPDVGAKLNSAAGNAAAAVKEKAADTASTAKDKAADTAEAAKKKAADAKDGDATPLIGQEKGSDYEPRVTKVQSR